jgi:hypothetical protein
MGFVAPLFTGGAAESPAVRLHRVGSRILAMRKLLLIIDSAINLLLGSVLLVFPPAIVRLLGVPATEITFYPSIFGAVLIGIGIALLLDLSRGNGHGDGLGLRGAVAINLCGGFALMAWLLLGSLDLPLRGEIFLWALSLGLVTLSTLESAAEGRRKRRSAR